MMDRCIDATVSYGVSSSENCAEMNRAAELVKNKTVTYFMNSFAELHFPTETVGLCTACFL